MRSSIKFYAVALLLLSTASAAIDTTELLDAARQRLPRCAFSCLIKVLTDLSCATDTDLACLWKSDEIEQQMTVCVRSTCSIRDSFITLNATQTVLGKPVRDQTRIVSYTGSIGGGIAILAFLLRVVSRISLRSWKGAWGADDWAMVITMLPVIPFNAISVTMAGYGLGRDIWTLSFDQIRGVLHTFYFGELLYIASVALTKISILLFYRRMFPIPWVLTSVNVMIGFGVCFMVSFLFASIFQCTPIRYAWVRWDGDHHGKCIRPDVTLWANSGLNILFDLIVIILPLHPLWNLKMNRGKKFQVMLMFAGGFLVTVTSCIRLQAMIGFANQENITWEYAPTGYWSTIEIDIGVIVACLPALRSLPNRFRSKLPTNTQTYGSKISNASNTPSRRRHTDIFDAVRDKRAPEPVDMETGLNVPKCRYHKRWVTTSQDTPRLGLSTRIQRGSVVLDKEVPFIGRREGLNLSNPAFMKSNRSSARSVGAGAAKNMNCVIQVKRDYSVTSEPASHSVGGVGGSLGTEDGFRGCSGKVTKEEIKNLVG